MENKNTKDINRHLSKMQAFISGALDGLEIDNTDDIVGKSEVIKSFKDLRLMLNDAQNALKKEFPDNVCPYCKRSEPCEGAYPEGCFYPKPTPAKDKR